MLKNSRVIDSPFETYFGVFLNFNCSLSCKYCVQKISCPAVPVARYSMKSGKDWVETLNSLANRRKKRFLRISKRKKISITGGEPTLHPDFAHIINDLDKDWRITITSNLNSPFFERASLLSLLKRRAGLKFNFSYHFLYVPMDKFIKNLKTVKDAGFFVHSIFIVAHPKHIEEANKVREKILKVHPVVKLQRFTGYHNNTLYPNESVHEMTYQQQDGVTHYHHYRDGFGQKNKKDIFCRIRKVLIAPNGDIYNCHYKLYTGHKDKFGNIFDRDLKISMPQDYFLCHDFGFCNPCDSEGHAFMGLNKEPFNISF